MSKPDKRLAAAYWIPIGEIRKWEHNPRKNDPAVPEVARSIRKYGFVAPCVVWESRGRLVAGHTRIKALESLLAEDPGFVPRDAPGPGLVPVRFHEFRDEAEANAYAIADNRLAEKAEWDDQLLGAVLEDIRALDEEMLEFTGFDAGEITSLIDGVQPPDPSEAPPAGPPPLQPTTRPGDLWILGRHRLLCGNSAEARDLDRLLGGKPVRLVNTDPPYNVRVEPRSNNAIAAAMAKGEKTGKGAVGADQIARVAQQQKTGLVRQADARGMHHQGFDLARDKNKAKATGPMRAKDRP